MRFSRFLFLFLIFFVSVIGRFSQATLVEDFDKISFGDPAKGRELFMKYDCHACHQVEHDRLLPEPLGALKAPSLGRVDQTLELYVVGTVDPNHVIAPGYAKGSVEDLPASDMPDYLAVMTLQELRDIVAYLMKAPE